MSKIIRITARVEGFRRAGLAHGKKPTDHCADDFTEAQLEALRAEPMLTVEEIDADTTSWPDGLEGPMDIEALLTGKVGDVVARLAELPDEIHAQALAAERAREKPRAGVLKALGAEA